MNKKTKGWIAAGLGGALLLGTGGTFALWSDTATLRGGDISTGDLTLGNVTATAWEWAFVSNAIDEGVQIGAAVDKDDLLVPGDAIKTTINLAGMDLKGSTLVAELYIDGVQHVIDDGGVVLDTQDNSTPLVLLVNGEVPKVEGDALIIASALTQGQAPMLPGDPSRGRGIEVTLGFPADSQNFHEPGSDGFHNGRKRSIAIGDVTLTLKQQVENPFEFPNS